MNEQAIMSGKGGTGVSPVNPDPSLRVSLGKKRIAIIWENFGPYHLARLRAAARVCDLNAIQIGGRSAFYAWDNEAPQGFKSETLFPSGTSRDFGMNEIARKMNESLDRLSPQVVFAPGWSSGEVFAAIAWCLRHAVPAVVMSDSTEWDERRVWWREWVKRQILKMCAAGVVAGQPHAEYLASLGMARERIFPGYDVVDNEYFAEKARAARSQAAEMRKRHGLPDNYFLASARFVPKKNLLNLVRAYARYRQRASSDPWSLVLLGDGPLRADLKGVISELHLEEAVQLPGFKQYPELPEFYALAKVLVHASTVEQWGLVVNEAMASGLPVLISNRCGCAQDLVQEGVNGFTFDPGGMEQLALLMLKVSAPDFPLTVFGDASRRIIAGWGPERFAAALQSAAQKALAAGPNRGFLIGKLILSILARRRYYDK